MRDDEDWSWKAKGKTRLVDHDFDSCLVLFFRSRVHDDVHANADVHIVSLTYS